PALEARGLACPGLAAVDFTLHRGEILGVGGLTGHGHRELFLTLFGARRASRGQILLDGKPARLRRPREAIEAGLALVPEDRKTEGLLLPMSVRDNLTLSILSRISRLGVIRAAREQEMTRRIAAALQIRTPRLGNAVGNLSGGNQQKVLVGRWLLAESRIILFYSSDADELAHLCHRVLVMREGRIAAALAPPALSAEAIVAAAVRDDLA